MLIRLLLVLTIIFTFALINLGGFVHNTGSSLACPDWPLCFGQVMPKMEGGVLIEHSHRLLGALVGFFVLLISIICFYSKKYRPYFKLSLGILFLVIFQGLLGGLTVIFKLPTIVSTAHLITSLIFTLCLVYFYHRFQSNKYQSKNKSLGQNYPVGLKHLYFITIVFTFVQIGLGGTTRHLGLGGACGFGWENTLSCFDVIHLNRSWWPVSTVAQIHFFHRMMAAILGALYFVVFVYGWKTYKPISLNKVTSSSVMFFVRHTLIFLLLLTQIGLGIWSVGSELGLAPTTLHLGIAALLVMLLWKQYLYLVGVEQTIENQVRSSLVSDLISLTKPRLSLLVVFTTSMGIFLAPSEFSFFLGLGAVLSTFLLVAGSCALNCYIEREIDQKMDRTKTRPLPAKRMKPSMALSFGTSLVLLSLAWQYIFLNSLTVILGAIASFSYLFIYTPLKQRSTVSLFVGAIPGALPPLIGWAAVENDLGYQVYFLFAIMYVWQISHFMAISIRYALDYQRARIKVTAVVSGFKSTVNKIWFYVILLIFVAYLPIILGFNSDDNYSYGTAFTSITIFLLACYGLIIKNNRIYLIEWAKTFFWSSLIYLPAQLLLLAFFQ